MAARVVNGVMIPAQELARYIVLNPVRAAMVRHPRLWASSSYGATITQGHRTSLS
jgi:hypothetical protein